LHFEQREWGEEEEGTEDEGGERFSGPSELLGSTSLVKNVNQTRADGEPKRDSLAPWSSFQTAP
jgi:hypothetical protein